MAQKIIKIGSSKGITLSKDLLGVIGADVGDAVEIQADKKARTIKITPKSKKLSKADQKIARLAMDFIERYSEDLQKLAK